MISHIKKFITYWFHPKYVLTHGYWIENRTIMTLRRKPVIFKDPEYNMLVVRYSRDLTGLYSPSNIYRKIWTKRGLRKWAKLLKDGKSERDPSACVKRTLFGWKRC